MKRALIVVVFLIPCVSSADDVFDAYSLHKDYELGANATISKSIFWDVDQPAWDCGVAHITTLYQSDPQSVQVASYDVALSGVGHYWFSVVFKAPAEVGSYQFYHVVQLSGCGDQSSGEIVLPAYTVVVVENPVNYGTCDPAYGIYLVSADFSSVATNAKSTCAGEELELWMSLYNGTDCSFSFTKLELNNFGPVEVEWTVNTKTTKGTLVVEEEDLWGGLRFKALQPGMAHFEILLTLTGYGVQQLHDTVSFMVEDCGCKNDCVEGEVACDGGTPWSCVYDGECWKKTNASACGFGCLDGVCLSQCEVECSSGQIGCDGNQTWTCVADELGCMKKSHVACSDYCFEGACQTCNDLCDLGTFGCDGETAWECVPDVFGCAYKVYEQCSGFCEAGSCATCTHACLPGSVGCGDGDIPSSWECGEDAHGCRFKQTLECSVVGADYCAGGVCLTCDSECVLGAFGCENNQSWLCVADNNGCGVVKVLEDCAFGCAGSVCDVCTASIEELAFVSSDVSGQVAKNDGICVEESFGLHVTVVNPTECKVLVDGSYVFDVWGDAVDWQVNEFNALGSVIPPGAEKTFGPFVGSYDGTSPNGLVLGMYMKLQSSSGEIKVFDPAYHLFGYCSCEDVCKVGSVSCVDGNLFECVSSFGGCTEKVIVSSGCESCVVDWDCTLTSACVDGFATQLCVDPGNCGIPVADIQQQVACNEPCVVESVMWNQAFVVDDQSVSLTIQLGGVCDGTKLSLELLENSFMFEEYLSGVQTSFDLLVDGGLVVEFDWIAPYVPVSKHDGVFSARVHADGQENWVVTPVALTVMPHIMYEKNVHSLLADGVSDSKCDEFGWQGPVNATCIEQREQAYLHTFDEGATSSEYSYDLVEVYDFADSVVLVGGCGGCALGADSVAPMMYVCNQQFPDGCVILNAFPDVLTCEMCGVNDAGTVEEVAVSSVRVAALLEAVQFATDVIDVDQWGVRAVTDSAQYIVVPDGSFVRRYMFSDSIASYPGGKALAAYSRDSLGMQWNVLSAASDVHKQIIAGLFVDGRLGDVIDNAAFVISNGAAFAGDFVERVAFDLTKLSAYVNGVIHLNVTVGTPQGVSTPQMIHAVVTHGLAQAYVDTRLKQMLSPSGLHYVPTKHLKTSYHEVFVDALFVGSDAGDADDWQQFVAVHKARDFTDSALSAFADAYYEVVEEVDGVSITGKDVLLARYAFAVIADQPDLIESVLSYADEAVFLAQAKALVSDVWYFFDHIHDSQADAALHAVLQQYHFISGEISSLTFPYLFNLKIQKIEGVGFYDGEIPDYTRYAQPLRWFE